MAHRTSHGRTEQAKTEATDIGRGGPHVSSVWGTQKKQGPGSKDLKSERASDMAKEVKV